MIISQKLPSLIFLKKGAPYNLGRREYYSNDTLFWYLLSLTCSVYESYVPLDFTQQHTGRHITLLKSIQPS